MAPPSPRPLPPQDSVCLGTPCDPPEIPVKMPTTTVVDGPDEVEDTVITADAPEVGKATVVERSQARMQAWRKAVEGHCLAGRDGYWTYEVCGSEGVRQFHVSDWGGTTSIDHSLGTYKMEDDKEAGGRRRRIYSQHFADGTSGRKTEVRYSCRGAADVLEGGMFGRGLGGELTGSRDAITAVREPTPLDYVIHVRLKLLCPERIGVSDPLPDALLHSSMVLALFLMLFTLLPLLPLRKLFPFVALPTAKERFDPKLYEMPLSPSTPKPEATPDLERTGECVICLEQMTKTAVGNCAHHFCVGCLLECCRLTPRCPRCQIPITAVHLDPEFDAVLKLARAADPMTACRHEPIPERELSVCRRKLAISEREVLISEREVSISEQGPPKPPPSRHVIRLRLPKGTRAGITLKTCRWRFGVAVSVLCEEKMAYRSGLRVDDVIVSMNGVPCRSHEQSTEVINRSSAPRSMADSEIVCLVIPNAAHVRPLSSDRDDDDAGRGVAAWGDDQPAECAVQ